MQRVRWPPLPQFASIDGAACELQVSTDRAASVKREVGVERSKCLTQCDKDLCSFDSRRGIEVVADIESHWTHRCLIAQPDSESVGVIRSKAAEPNMLKNIPTVIKSGNAKVFLDWQGNPKFRIHDEQFSPALRRLNLAASCGIVGIA